MPSTLRSGRAPRGSGAGERDVHQHGAVLRGRIDARHAAFDLAVARVDGGALADLHVLGLRFRNPQLGLQPAGHGHAREVRPGRHALADLDGHDLQHALDAGAHLERVGLAASQLVERPPLCDPRLLGGELRVRRAAANLQTLLLDAMAVGQLVGLDLRDLRE